MFPIRPMFLRSSFVRNVAVLASGQGMALLIAFLLTPIISRIFTPADYGIAAIFVAMTQLVSQMSSLNYQLVIVLPNSDAKAGEVVVLAKVVLAIFVLILLSVLVVMETVGFGLPFEETLGVWVWAIPFVAFAIGAGNIRNSVLIRSKQFAVSARAGVGQALSMSISRIGLGLMFGSSVWGLITGYLLGYLVRFRMLRGGGVTYDRISPVTVGWKRLGQLAKEYNDFPLFNVPSALMVGISAKLPLLLFGLWLSPVVVGFYAMAMRLIRTPVDGIANGLRTVYLQKAAELERKGQKLEKVFLIVTGMLILSGLIPFGVLWVYGEEILGFVLGDSWREAGKYAEILAPWIFLMWASAAVSPTMVVRRKQGVFTALQLAMFACRACVLGWCYIQEADVEHTLTLFTWTNVSLMTLVLMFGFKYSSSKYQLAMTD